MAQKLEECRRKQDKDCVSPPRYELTERGSRLAVTKAAFFQLGSSTADGPIKQAVWKQVEMDAPGLGSTHTSQQISLCLDQNNDFDSLTSWMSCAVMNPLKAKLAGLSGGRGGSAREMFSES